MGNSLASGVSGLRAHSNQLDVIGNNLANLNTIGYKSRQVYFSDLIYDLRRSASGGVSTDRGGVNPVQVGSGVQIAQIGNDLSQGNLDATGGQFDFGIEGEGYFVASNGSQSYYTRGGAFGLDEAGNLVDPATGYHILRFESVGELPNTTFIGPIDPEFQTAGDQRINIPIGAIVPGESTSLVEISGVLSANATGPESQLLITTNGYTTGSGTAASTSTPLNNLDSNLAQYMNGDVIQISGTDTDGGVVNASFNVTATSTLGDLVAAIDSAFVGATASLDSVGNILLEADSPGNSRLNLVVSDGPGNVGTTDFGNHLPVVATVGNRGDIFETAVEVFDSRGGSHSLNLSFQKVSDNTWMMSAALNATDGVVLDGNIQEIRFNDDGSFQQVAGVGLGDPNISFQVNGFSTPQTIRFTFGSSNSFEGLTHVAASSAISARQNGSSSGVLTSTSVNTDGTIEGIASNGRKVPIAQLAVALFRNAQGLNHVGNNYFQESLNTGGVQLGTALSGGRGAIFGGQLESSNVDIAVQLTRIIVAQRGFSANARSITIADEVLEELTNLVG